MAPALRHALLPLINISGREPAENAVAPTAATLWLRLCRAINNYIDFCVVATDEREYAVSISNYTDDLKIVTTDESVYAVLYTLFFFLLSRSRLTWEKNAEPQNVHLKGPGEPRSNFLKSANM